MSFKPALYQGGAGFLVFWAFFLAAASNNYILKLLGLLLHWVAIMFVDNGDEIEWWKNYVIIDKSKKVAYEQRDKLCP